MASTTAVASVVYNLAGEEINRPNYLKSLVVQNILSGTKKSIGEDLHSGYMNGPAMRLRSFYKWAANFNNYGQIGMPVSTLQVQGDVDPVDVQPYIPPPSGKSIEAQQASVGLGDTLMFARQWILANDPAEIDTDWVLEYDEDVHEFTITFVDTSTATFGAGDFEASSTFIYCYYQAYASGPVYDPLALFIYRVGNGEPALDALVEAAASYGGFFPFIPIRLSNEFLSESHLPLVYAETKRAFKKAVDGSLDDLVAQLEDNADLADIDHAYVSFGVCLNTISNSAKKYVYRFFRNLYAAQHVDSSTSDESSRNEVRVYGSGEVNSKHDMRVRWTYISDEVNTVGLFKPDAYRDEISIEHLSTDGDGRHTMRIYWQETTTTYLYFDVFNCVHRNYVYGSNYVSTSTKNAIQDDEESAFIVPLHYQTFIDMPLVDASQMSTACVYIVFNCYETRKTKWYESSIFKIFLIVVIAIASVIFTAGAGIGILGAHLAVGTALGFSGITAAIVGAVANALAAMVLTTLLSKALSGLGVVGEVLAVVIMIVVGNVAASFQSTGMLAMSWGSLLRVDNLLKLTEAVGRGLVGQLTDEMQEMQGKFNNFLENREAEAKKIQQAYFEEFGYGAGVIDPFMFVDSSSGPIAESSSTFLTRTLMTGSEIAEMSRELLYDFPSLSLQLPNAYT